MFKIACNLILSALIAGIIFLAACSSPPASPNSVSPQSVALSGSQPAAEQPARPPIQQSASTDNGTNTGITSASTPSVPLSANRVEVIYSHMNQRCPTCLCFEERINTVIETYFSDAIANGKLTYRVVNAQDPQNDAFVRKFKAVGSQLFINTIVNGFDNIEDIQDIWNWDCRNNQHGFDLKVRDAIEQRLKSLS